MQRYSFLSLENDTTAVQLFPAETARARRKHYQLLARSDEWTCWNGHSEEASWQTSLVANEEEWLSVDHSLISKTKLKTRTWTSTCALFSTSPLSKDFKHYSWGSICATCGYSQVPQDVITSQCTLSTEGAIGAAATVLWFIIAAGCSRMARQTT